MQLFIHVNLNDGLTKAQLKKGMAEWIYPIILRECNDLFMF